jgi:GMP synthase-like glutamine amidotransferase
MSVGIYCEYESIKPKIRWMKALIVDNLLKDETHVSEVARREPGFDAKAWLKNERYIAALALENIEQNVRRLVQEPEVRIVHFSEVTDELLDEFDPDAIVLSGTLRDFDFYKPELLEKFKPVLRHTRIPVLGICGGHQMIGMFWGAQVKTLDGRWPWERRANRVVEYQYRFIKVLHDDPIFAGVGIHVGRGKAHGARAAQRLSVIKVWQNHGLKIDRVPEGFINLAKSYLCDIQMMVNRSEGRLIYTVQYHLEKSFEDWKKNPTFWQHRIESRDGRIIFENFLYEALKHRNAERRMTTQ